jgi:thymidylate synthase (FAD)
MSVKLVWVTPDAENLISDMARVSNPSNQGNYDTSDRLIRYLIKHRHWSPFEMASMCLEINTNRGIAAQILRHRSFSFQEFSQRYADVGALTDIEVPELRRQDTKNRQNSTDDLPFEIKAELYEEASILIEQSKKLYNKMLDKGVAKESARFFLPIATPSRLYMTGTVRSWLHYIDLRSANGTQKEHMDIAIGCKNILEEHLPNVCRAMWGKPPIQLQQELPKA